MRSSQTADAIVQQAEKTPVGKDTLDAFKTFADDVDAWLLDDQIEAAAAYSTHILGQEEFSRPDLMSFVLAYNDGKEVSREDMLRGFGTLLREGRLERGKPVGSAWRPHRNMTNPRGNTPTLRPCQNWKKAPACRRGFLR